MRLLERLIGMKLLDAEVSADGAGFQFSDCALVAFNPVSLANSYQKSSAQRFAQFPFKKTNT